MFKSIKKRYFIVVSLVLIVITVAILSTVFIRNAGSWLLISDTVPDRLDLVFTFAGENVRDTYSRELMTQFPNAYWLMSDYKGGYSRILRRDKFDMTRVSIVDTCTNTLAEVTTLSRWIDKKDNVLLKGEDSIYVGLVSGPYHMRRIKMMVEKNLPEQNVRFFFLPVPMEKYNWTDEMFRKWWKSPVTKEVSSEITKIAYFLLIS